MPLDGDLGSADGVRRDEERRVERFVRLVEDLPDVSRIEAGRLELGTTDVDLSEKWYAR